MQSNDKRENAGAESLSAVYSAEEVAAKINKETALARGERQAVKPIGRQDK